MKISTKAPDWIRVNPAKEHPEVSCEIRIFDNEEGLEFSGDVRVGRLLVKREVEEPIDENDLSKGTQKKVIDSWDYYSPLAREYLRRHVRKIEGVEINGVKIKEPKDIFDKATGYHTDVALLVIRMLQALFDHNTLSEDEAKKSGALVGENGEASEKAKPASAKSKKSSPSSS